MDMMNRTTTTTTTMLTSFNCTVDTNYHFAYYQIAYSLIFSFGLASNVMALRRLWIIPRNLTSTAVYMANLAAVDLFFIVSLPLRIYYYYNRYHDSAWFPGRAFCLLTFTLKYISLYGGIFFLVCIGVDRYFAVVHPLLQRLRQVRTARVLSSMIWLVVLALSLTLPFLLSAASLRNHPCMLDPSSQRHHTFILVALALVQAAFLLPALLLIFSYCSVLRVLCKLALRKKAHHKRTLTVIYWVLGVFLLCFAPYHFNLLGYTLTHTGVLRSCGLAKVTTALHPIVLSLASSNCCLNPLIYYFSSNLVHKQVAGHRGMFHTHSSLVYLSCFHSSMHKNVPQQTKTSLYYQ
ncbi:lysophosphatidic acid receptor 6-like [Astyanax mexicanus]|uniref:Lysophosphatidic acid receptor 6-like n=1 Tax=Astyanax mexicanus TaxID=7994 RepID=A0A8T2L3H3_ASTMX|nr:lysophosphatidic acid receptor 6-like [Astyanax mexicanus]